MAEERKQKPKIDTSLIFFHRFGILDRELWGKDKMFRGGIAPQFFMSNGSEAKVPHVFQQAVYKMTEAVTCTKCKHQHLLEPPAIEVPGYGLGKREGVGSGGMRQRCPTIHG